MDSGAIESRIPELREEQLSELQSAILKRLSAGRGRIPTPYKIWIQNPMLAEPLEKLGAVLNQESSLSKREQEIAVLLIARHWQAAYVSDVHQKDAIKAGLPEAAIADLRAAGSSSILTEPRDRILCDIVRGFAESNPLEDAQFEEALRLFGHNGLAELLVLCGYFTSVCLAMKLYRVPSPAGS